MAHRLYSCVLALASVLLILLFGGSIGATPLGRRYDTSELTDLKGGVLFKGGNQTFCALALINEKSAFVTASCLDFYENTDNLYPPTMYEVYINGAFDNNPGRYMVSNVTVHPEYDPFSGANDIAILQYTPDNEKPLTVKFAAVPDKWSSVVYIQQALSDVETGTWGPLYTYDLEITNDDVCSELFGMYVVNQNDYTCINKIEKPSVEGLSSCDVPYTTAYASYDDKLYLAGLFSSAVIVGGDILCKFDQMRTYYTLLANYLAFAEEVLDIEIPRINEDDSSINTDPDYKMNMPNRANVKAAAKRWYGDFYYYGFLHSPDPDSEDTSVSDGLDTEGDAASDTGGLDDGLSRGATIAVAICCSIGAILGAVGLFYAIRWWKAHKLHGRDPILENNAMDILRHDLGSPSVPGIMDNDRDDSINDFPPAYSEGMGAAHRGAGTQAPAEPMYLRTPADGESDAGPVPKKKD
ncbi:hypothetical protein GGF46_003884 [Coemansia sp. RSA 552]|nr:hypothetical protein GGF46_003884 [Coemansia sp. RSA 552]